MADPSKRHPRCAACRLLMYTCSPECPYAAHFPAGQPQRLRDVQRVFGLQRILNFITAVGPGNQDDILNCIVYEAQAWVADHVRGPAGVVRARRQELESVRAEISALRLQHQLQPPPSLPNFFFPEDVHLPMPSSSSKPSRRHLYPRCAACQYIERTCWPGCPLAPYFPAGQPLDHIMHVHRLFGSTNMLRLIEEAGLELRDEVMNSIIYNAQAWVRDPRHGAAGVVRALEQEIERGRAELAALQQQDQQAVCHQRQPQPLLSDFPDPESVHQPTAALMPPTMFPATVQGNEASSSTTAQDGHHQAATYFPANPWHQANSLLGRFQANSLFGKDAIVYDPVSSAANRMEPGGSSTVQHQPAAPSHQAGTPALDPPANELMPPPAIPRLGNEEPEPAAQCSACRFLERTCSLECLLAPYFPADQPELFQILLRLGPAKVRENLFLIEQIGPDRGDREDVYMSVMLEARMLSNQAQPPPAPEDEEVGQYLVDETDEDAVLQHSSSTAATTSRDGMELSGSNAEQHQQALDLPADNPARFDDNSLLFGSDPLGAGHHNGAIVYETDARAVNPVSGAGGMDPSLNQDQMSPMTLQDHLTEQDLAQFLPDAPPNDEIHRDG